MEKKFVKIAKESLTSKKAGISYFQILILIIATFAFSWMIYQTSKDIEIVSAETTPTFNTCKETKTGEKCQEMLSTECNDDCKTACFPGRIQEYSECKLGCCIATDGKCIANSPKGSCEQSGGTWKDNKECNPGNVQECKLGCCVLGQEVRALVAEKECQKYSIGEMDYRAGMNEPECLALSLTQEMGACKLEDSCEFTTHVECASLQGFFSAGYLCSNPKIASNCTKQAYTGCVEDRDEVYWFDSCGNRENIYSSDKTKSWNNGLVLEKEASCSPSSNNANSDCGNCNYFLGSKCSIENNKAVCKDMSCKNAPANGGGKKDRKNGESWCVYDSQIGQGKDIPGSRHYRYSCINGEVKVEGCADFRNEICVESDIKLDKGTFSSASCRINRWQQCLEYNMQETGTAKEKQENMAEECQKNEDCFVKKINIDSGFKFNYCLPQYPPGFQFSSEGSEATAQQICSMASQKCTVIYEKEFGGWDCKQNCNCEKAVFTQKMNEFCSSLGDCGGKVNIAGDYSGSYSVKVAPKLSPKYIAGLKTNAIPVKGQKAVPGNFTDIMATLGFKSSASYSSSSEAGGFAEFTMGASAIGVTGVVLATHLTFAGIFSGSFIGVGTGASTLTGGIASAGLAGFVNGALGGFVGAAVGFVVAKIFGLSGDAAMIVVTGTSIGAAIVAISQGGLHAGFFGLVQVGFLGFLIWTAVIAIVLTIFTKIFGIGDTKKRVVTFTCKPWQPPAGGANCDLCNKNSLQGCSKYQCESLGKACKFINPGTSSEKCIASINDHTAPTINYWNIDSNLSIEKTSDGVKIKQTNGECIQEFTPILLGIKTNKPTQCKYDIVSSANWELMIDAEDFGSNLFIENHSLAFSLPSVDSIAEQFNITRQKVIEKYGNLKFYVRCQDDWGNFNPKEYLIEICVKTGPDVTAPSITRFEPEDGSFIAFNATEKQVTLYTNEPADCKWSKQTDKEYDLMTNAMNCLTDLQDQEAYGWPCSAILNNLTDGENKFYFRCKDKPWLPDNNGSRNVNKEGTEYLLAKSASELKIKNIEPNGTIIAGGEPFSVTLRAETEGGAENGKASCYYSFTGNDYIQFFDTFSSEHLQIFSQLVAGSYNIRVRCEDVAGNSAEKSTSIKLEIDTRAPKIIRVYNSNALKIITDENSECAYSNDNCNFIWQNASKMTGLLKEHDAPWTENQVYYIKCKDLWDNKQNTCFTVKTTQ